jgi:hypothetical protein
LRIRPTWEKACLSESKGLKTNVGRMPGPVSKVWEEEVEASTPFINEISLGTSVPD